MDFLKSIIDGINSVKSTYAKFMLHALLTLIVLGLALLIVISCYSILKGRHTKLKDGEFNIPDNNIPIKIDKTKVSVDSASDKKGETAPINQNLKVEKNNRSIPAISRFKPLIVNSTIQPPPLINNGTNNHVVNGTNNGINGDVNVNTEPPQRHIDDSIIKSVGDLNPKHLPIEIIYFPNNECSNLYQEFNSKLTERGYKVQFRTRWSALGNDKVKKDLEYQSTDSIFYIGIFKQK